MRSMVNSEFGWLGITTNSRADPSKTRLDPSVIDHPRDERVRSRSVEESPDKVPSHCTEDSTPFHLDI